MKVIFSQVSEESCKRGGLFDRLCGSNGHSGKQFALWKDDPQSFHLFGWKEKKE